MSDKVVYSTDPEWNIPDKTAGPINSKPKQSEPVRVSYRKGHKGSGLTLIEKLQMHPEGKEELLKKFKKKFGAGGTVKFGILELQGDRRPAVQTELLAMGYKVRLL